jgi:hypothetical protein
MSINRRIISVISDLCFEFFSSMFLTQGRALTEQVGWHRLCHSRKPEPQESFRDLISVAALLDHLAIYF